MRSLFAGQNVEKKEWRRAERAPEFVAFDQLINENAVLWYSHRGNVKKNKFFSILLLTGRKNLGIMRLW